MDEPSEAIPLGTIRTRDDGTRMRRVRVVAGRGVWAYFCAGAEDHVIADIFYNRHAHHFAGQLELIHKGPVEDQWLIIEGFQEPPREIRRYIEDEDVGLPRMEHRS